MRSPRRRREVCLFAPRPLTPDERVRTWVLESADLVRRVSVLSTPEIGSVLSIPSSCASPFVEITRGQDRQRSGVRVADYYVRVSVWSSGVDTDPMVRLLLHRARVLARRRGSGKMTSDYARLRGNHDHGRT